MPFHRWVVEGCPPPRPWRDKSVDGLISIQTILYHELSKKIKLGNAVGNGEIPDAGDVDGPRRRLSIDQMLELAVGVARDGSAAVVRRPAEGRAGDDGRDAQDVGCRLMGHGLGEGYQDPDVDQDVARGGTVVFIGGESAAARRQASRLPVKRCG